MAKHRHRRFQYRRTIVNFGSLLLAYRSSARTAATWLVVFIIVTWIGPLFADTIVHQLMDQYVADRAPWSITAFGPIGTMLSPWQPEIQTTAGLGCQIGIVAAMMLIASIAESKRRRRTMRSNDVTELAIGLT